MVAIPQACEVEVVERALQKAAAEREVRAAIENGTSSTEAFNRHDVL